ncbi:MAG: tyrosine-type recombinase/integrase [Chloroflexota bacterium]|nr:tyrosine-type recombinase/integrase [Chloroflexota bacterium]
MHELLHQQNAQIQAKAGPRPLASSIVATQRSSFYASQRPLHEWFLLTREADGCSKSTLRWFSSSLKDLLTFCETEGFPTDLANLESEHLIAWLVHLRNRTDKNPDHHSTNKLKQNTMNGYWRGVKRFYKWGIETGKLEYDPTIGIKGPKAKRSFVPVFKEHHVAAMLDLCPPNTPWGARDRAIIITLLLTGVRREELVSMRLTELDMEHHRITVRGKGSNQKGSKERTVYLDRKVMRAILDWLMFRPDNGSDALWTTSTGTPMTTNAVRLVIRRLAAKIKAPDVRISAHTFRHTFAINVLREGKDVRFLQAVMGHEGLESTEIYVRTLSQEDALEWRKGIDPFKGWRL